MPTVAQQASEVDILGVAGAPFTLLAEIAAQDPDGNPLDWSIFSDFAVALKGIINGLYQAGPAAAIPTITTPSSGQVLLSWTAEQTALLGGAGNVSWALQTDVSSEGPYPLVAGSLAMGDPTTPGASTSATVDLTVNIGAGVQISVTVSLGGGGGGGGSGSVNSVNDVGPDGSGNVELTAADVGADVSGAAAGVQTNLNAEAVTRASAVTTLAGAISSETTRAEAAETANASAISAETMRAETAEATKASTSALSAETTRAEGAESTNASAISAETTRAEAAESTNATAIAAETTRAEGAESTNATAIAAETTRAEAAEAAALQKANNLSDAADAGTSRYNLHVPTIIPVAACSNGYGNLSITAFPLAVLDNAVLESGVSVILLTAQTTASQDGPWIYNGVGNALVRPTEFPHGGTVYGRIVTVLGGSMNGGTTWALQAALTASPYTPGAGAITIDTTAQLWFPTATPYGIPIANTSSPQFNPARMDTSGVASTLGSSTVTDNSITANDVGLPISHPAFPALATFVGTVTPGVSFTAVDSSGNPVLASQSTSGYIGIGLGITVAGIRSAYFDLVVNNAIASLPFNGGIVYMALYPGAANVTIRNSIVIGNGYNNAVKAVTASSSKNGGSTWGGAGRTDTGCSVAGSVITDPSLNAMDVGCKVTVGSAVGYVTAISGTSFTLSSAPSGGTPVAGATGTTVVFTACTFFATLTDPTQSNPNPQQTSFPVNGGGFSALCSGMGGGVIVTYTYADSTGFHGVTFSGGSSSNGAPVNGDYFSQAVASTRNGVQLWGPNTSQTNVLNGVSDVPLNLLWGGGDVVGPVIDVRGPVTGWELKNFNVSGNGSMLTNAGGGIGIRFTSATGGHLDNVTVQKCPFAAVQTRAYPVSNFESNNNSCNRYERLSIWLMQNVNGAYGIDINGVYAVYPGGSASANSFDSDTFLDEFELLCYWNGPGTSNTNTMIHFGNCDVNRIKLRLYQWGGGVLTGTTNLIMFDYTDDTSILGSNIIDFCGNCPVGGLGVSPNLIVNNGTPASVATYFPNRIINYGTEDQGSPPSLANLLFGYQASQNPTWAAQTFTSGTGAQCTATSISVDNLAYITVTAGGTLTVALSEQWGNAGYTTIFNAVTVTAGMPFPTIRVPAGCYLKLTAAGGAAYTTELQAVA